MKSVETLGISFLTSILLIVVLPGLLLGQSASSGTVVGTVTDSSGAVVTAAAVDLTSPATSLKLSAQSNTDGQYVFPNVPPGEYNINVSARGFRQTVLRVRVEVAKSTRGDITLEVGDLTQQVEVVGGVQAELQTLDSTVGNVISDQEFVRLPTVQRRASELIYLQVATTPISGAGFYGGGAVAGGRTDQNTATLDGIVITDLVLGGELSGSISQFHLPVDAISEFRGSVSNPNETQAGSGGGQFAFSSSRGTNDWHGSAYWYHQNDNLNANSWTRNRLNQRNPELKDNRFGFRLGGPAWKDKLWFFAFYEGRRFPQGTDATRVGISESLRRGILSFRDATNTLRQYNLNPANGPLAALCGPQGNLPCDPRGIGFNPIIRQYFDLYPVANNVAVGDGLNTGGISTAVDTNILFDTTLARLDYNLTNKWRAFGNFFYQRQLIDDTTQLELNPKETGGKLLKSLSGLPHFPKLFTAGVTGELTPTLIFNSRFGYNKQGFQFKRGLPITDLVPGLGGFAVDLGAVDDPGDPVITRARPEGSDTHIYQLNNSVSWVKGNHVFNGGLLYRHVNSFHFRVDKIPAHMVPILNLTSGANISIPNTQRPPTCGGTIQTNCLQTGDVGNWNTLYSVLLGMWDNTQTFNPRDAQGNSLGRVPLANTHTSDRFEVQLSDVWRIKPSLTMNLGLNVTYETPYREVDDKDYFIVDATNGSLIRPHEVLAVKADAAARGGTFNQQMAYVRSNSVGGRDIYPPVFNAGPRAALAWNPSFKGGALGTLFGDRKTVLRGGYSLVNDQILIIGPQLWGIIGNEILSDSTTITGPTCDRSGTPGPACVPGVTPFRVGVDGSPRLPAPGPVATPFIPRARNTLVAGSGFGVGTGYAYDPDFKVGRIHGLNFTLQRELPGNVLLETGWIGRWGRDLSNSVNLNAPPVNLRDLTGRSNQIFAEAFDAVAGQLRSGAAPANVTPQPWFENLYGPGGTRVLAAAQSGNFVTGNIATLFSNATSGIDARLQQLGMPTVLNQQFGNLTFHTFGSLTNYNAFFASARKRFSRGLSATFNYTWSHCTDTFGRQNDEQGGAWANPYNRQTNYGDCISDIRHLIQNYGTYDFPGPKAGLIGKLIGGWYFSWIFTAHTGRPLSVTQGAVPFGAVTCCGTATSAPPLGEIPRPDVHSGVTGSGLIGTTNATGLNLFANPEAVFRSLRYTSLVSDQGHSYRGHFRQLGRWNLDSSIGKRTRVTEKVSINFGADFFNIFNHVNFFTPGLSLTAPATFGVITAQESPTILTGDINVGPRRVQFFFRVDF